MYWFELGVPVPKMDCAQRDSLRKKVGSIKEDVEPKLTNGNLYQKTF